MTSKQLVIETEFYLYIKVGLYSKRNSQQISVLYFIKIQNTRAHNLEKPSVAFISTARCNI